MPDVEIRNVPDWVVEVYRARANSAGHTLEEEMRTALSSGAAGREAFLREAAEFQDRLRQKYGELPDSTPGIREDREARG